MKSEHRPNADETDAFSKKSRRYMFWQRGELKRIKQLSHRKDRRRWKQRNKDED